VIRDRRRRCVEERGCASDSELESPDDSGGEPTTELAVVHPKPISQFKRLAFLDLEDDMLHEPIFPEYEEPLSPPPEDQCTRRPLQGLTSGPVRCQPLAVPMRATDDQQQPLAPRCIHPTLGHGFMTTGIFPLTGPSILPVILEETSSESQSVTSMSCDHDTATSEEDVRLISREERKRILLDRLMHYFHSILASNPSHLRTHGAHDSPSTHGSGSSTVGHRTQASSTQRDRASRQLGEGDRKRLQEDDDGDDEGDGGSRKKPRHKTQSSDEDAPMRLACPFFKKNPRRFRTSRSCPGPGWATVHRVK
jgi:hypothetical protein